MKRRLLCLFAAAVLCGMLGFPSAVPISAEEEIPSLFCNDEAWYKDGAAPMITREEIHYVPAELFGLFESVSVTSPSENNLLICNTADDRYISLLFSEGRAAVNGTIVQDVRSFRDAGVTYVDAVQVAETVGITAETIVQEDGRVSMRLCDGNHLLTTEELLAAYLPEEPDDEFADLEEEEELNLKRIFILCREPSPGTEKSALDLLKQYEMGYTLFLTGDTSTESLLDAMAGGAYGILTSETGEEAVADLNAVNESFRKITRYKTHLTMTTGSYESDNRLINAAYCPVAPDFIVDTTVDAATMFADMLQYLGGHDYCVLQLEDCPQTEEMLKLMNKINREQFITSNLGD
ncbi:MAG: hypothetical protein J6I42_07230 [Clostridia bacterium]|nr:hypothetical protein [Clostridia bacterium]